MRKNMRGRIRRRLRVFTLLAVLSLQGFGANAATPYDSYSYSHKTGEAQAVLSPAPYVPERIVSGQDLGCELSAPADLVKGSDGCLYIVDTGNNQIHRLSHDLKLRQTYKVFLNGGVEDTFKEPQGLYVDQSGLMYITDAANHRLVLLRRDGTLERIIAEPKSELFPEGYIFYPQKITADDAGRIYLIVKNDYNGIMELDSEGVFVGYVGSSPVQYDPLTMLWKQLMTKAQREKMVLFLPIEYTNMQMDSQGFIFAVSKSKNESQPIKRLNGSGADILERNGYDSEIRGDYGIVSSFVDVCVDTVGNYSLLDAEKGRIFTYNENGFHLYTFGALGNRKGTFRTPVAIEYLDDQLLVLDKTMGNITVFSMTEYAMLIRQGNQQYNQGLYTECRQTWEQVIRMNANFEFAYMQIGKALCWEGQYEEAMRYFVMGNYRGNQVFESDGYNKAFVEYRSAMFIRYLPVIMTAVITIVAGIIIIKIVRRVRKRAKSYYHAD